MDRRQAIKRITGGSAAAIGGYAVITSFDVAAAASIPEKGITGLPEDDEIPFATDPTDNGRINVTTGAGSAVCVEGDTPTIVYTWIIESYSMGGTGNPSFTIRLPVSDDVVVQGSTATYGGPDISSATSSTYGNVVLRRRSGGSGNAPLQTGDTYSVRVVVNWQCGTNAPVQAVYRFTGSGPGVPSATVVSPPT